MQLGEELSSLEFCFYTWGLTFQTCSHFQYLSPYNRYPSLVKSDRKWDASEREREAVKEPPFGFDPSAAGTRTQPLHTGRTLHQPSYWGATNTATISLFPAPVEENQYVTCNCNADKLCIRGAHTHWSTTFWKTCSADSCFLYTRRGGGLMVITTMMMQMMMMTVMMMMMIMTTLRTRDGDIDVMILADHWMAALAWCPISRGSCRCLRVSAKKDPVLQRSWEMTTM